MLFAAAPGWSLMAEAQSTVPGFFITVSDLPMMAGMAELTDEALFYDKPGGRIVEVAARGKARRSEAVAFYAGTLPQLGWSAGSDGYERDGERLRISYQQAGDQLIVRLSINPK